MSNAAITLIALVITIIVLLILAGVTLNMVIGENGILGKANISKEETNKSTATEKLKLKILEYKAEVSDKKEKETLKGFKDFCGQDSEIEYVKLYVEENGKLVDANENIPTKAKVKLKGYTYEFIIDDKLKIVSVDGKSNASEDSKSDETTKIDKAIRYGTDKNITDFFSDASTATVMYNDKKIISTKELPVGEWNLKYDKNANVINIINEKNENEIEDLSGNKHNLYLQNGARISKDDDEKYYLELDGIDDYGQINEIDGNINWKDGYTVEFEAEWNAFNRFSRIFDFGNGAGSDNILVSNSYGSSNLLYIIMNGSNQCDYTFLKDILKLNEKVNIKIVYEKIDDNNFKVKFYKSGELVSEFQTKYTVNNIKRIYNYIGKPNWSDCEYFKGKIYSLKITQADGKQILNYNIDEYAKKENQLLNKKIYIVGDNYNGKIEDLTGNNYKLNLKNDAKILKDTNEKYYLELDGIDDYGQINEIDGNINWKDGYTVEFEAEWNAFNRFSRIFDFGNGTGSDNILVSNYESSNYLLFIIMNGGYQCDYTFVKDTLKLNEKVNIKIVYEKIDDNNYKVKFYKDGELVSEYQTKYTVNNIKRIYNYVGKANWSDCGYFKGKIYSLKITQADGKKILWYDVNKWLELSE